MVTKWYKNRRFWKNSLHFAAGVFILLTAVIVVWLSSLRIPDFTSFDDRKVVSSTKIYDRTGQVLLYDLNKDVRRTNITFDQMSPNIRNATVAVEDAGFYSHGGIKISSIIRAGLADVFGTGRTQGGSTITQQLVKNTLLTPKKTLGRKIKEWILAIKIDNSMTKDKILEAYLNEIPYGGTIYGIQEASQTYFSKNAADLDLAQSAYLASIPQSPTTLSPYGKNLDKLETRKNFVLSRMHDLGMITDDEYANAKSEVVTFSPQKSGGIKAPHFVFFIKDYLVQKYGAEMVESGGLKVVTTLDYNLQQKAEDIVKTGALANEKTYNAKNASLVAIDPKTGQILALVGSRDYFDKEVDGNFDIALASRQPGSSFKPFIYATAFTKGFTPDTVLFDLPTEFQTTCDAYGKALPGHSQADCYMPQDYDGKTRGPMSLRNALAQSINIPAVKLFYLVGLKNGLQTAESMGVSTLGDSSLYGLTLVIGGGEVNLLDMTSSYGVFANDGNRDPYTGIMEIDEANGKVLEQYTQNEIPVLPKNAALTISDILSDNVARTPTFGAASALYLPGKDVAVKTGTTNNDKDAWTIGYTPSLVVGVWAGNNDNAPMKSGGSAVAAPIWNKFMNAALATMPSENFEAPDLTYDPQTVKPVLRGVWQGNENFFVDKVSGKLATADTPKETTEEKVVTNVHSILYWVNKNDITGPPPANPASDPQFNHWEIPVQRWWAQNSYKYGQTTVAEKPFGSDDVHTGGSGPVISIISPNAADIYPANEKIQLQVSSMGAYPLQKIDVFVNDTYLDTVTPPFNFSFVPSTLENIQDENELRLVAYDSVYNRKETTLTFKVKQ